MRLSQEQFRDALRKGLGRAVIHVEKFGIAGLEDDLIHGCLNSLVYDPQFEGTRGGWLFHLVTLADLTESIRPLVIDKLLQPSKQDDYWTVAQLYALAAEFASAGNESAKSAVYEKFKRREFVDPLIGGYHIVSLDKLSGLICVVEEIGDRLRNESGYEADVYAFEMIYDELGLETVEATLAERALQSLNVQAFLDFRERKKQEAKLRVEEIASPPQTANEILKLLNSQDVMALISLRRWGRHASEDDLTKILERVETETDAERLRKLLFVFQDRQMPRLSQRIMELTLAEDSKISDLAIRSLANHKAEQIRDLALRLLRNKQPIFGAIRLLALNYESGDDQLVESVLPKSGDADSLHAVCQAITSVIGEQTTPELRSCMHWVYAQSPCSWCRHYVLSSLIEWGLASRELLEECLEDCEEDTQEAAQAALAAMDILPNS